MRSWSVNNWLPGHILTLPPPLPFSQTGSEKEEERDVFSPTRNKLPKGSESQFFFFFLYTYVLYTRFIHYIQYVHISFWVGGGSVEQPPMDPNGKALNQPKPHLSNRTVCRCYVTSSGRLTKFAPRKLPTGRP